MDISLALSISFHFVSKPKKDRFDTGLNIDDHVFGDACVNISTSGSAFGRQWVTPR